MKIYRRIIIFLLFVSICAVVFFAVQIYAKYLTSKSGIASMPIARWNIKVNNVSIKNNTNFSQTILPVFPGNEHIAANIIAPTAEGYFDLVFDFSGADVSFTYNISFSVNVDSLVSDIIATGYSVDNGNVINFDTNPREISDTIYYNSGIDSRTIRVFVLWDDSSASFMNNFEDALATTVNDASALLDVNVSFTQVID